MLLTVKVVQEFIIVLHWDWIFPRRQSFYVDFRELFVGSDWEMKWAEKIVLFKAGNYEKVPLADKDKQQKYVKVWTTYPVPNNLVFAQNEVF